VNRRSFVAGGIAVLAALPPVGGSFTVQDYVHLVGYVK
jgi:hypothetical protein